MIKKVDIVVSFLGGLLIFLLMRIVLSGRSYSVFKKRRVSPKKNYKVFIKKESLTLEEFCLIREELCSQWRTQQKLIFSLDQKCFVGVFSTIILFCVYGYQNQFYSQLFVVVSNIIFWWAIIPSSMMYPSGVCFTDEDGAKKVLDDYCHSMNYNEGVITFKCDVLFAAFRYLGVSLLVSFLYLVKGV